MTISTQHIDELLAYLPRLEYRQKLLDSNRKIKKADDCPAVLSFFETLQDSPLHDYEYKPVQVERIMQNIAKADLADLRQALTYCLRYKYWTNSWALVIDRRKGDTTVIDLLKRLREIREEMRV